MIFGVTELRNSSKKFIGGTFKADKKLIRKIIKLVEEGAIKPVIDRTYPMEKIAEAHRYVDSGRKKGDVIITIKHN